MISVVEKWRPIEGYEGLYEVSNYGDVKSLNYNHTGKEKILRTQISNCGYVQVALTTNNKQRRCYVHRLVAQTFIPNPDNLPMINHKDEVKTNNCVDNLEWCTAKYNVNYGTGIERCVKAQSKPIKQYTLDGEFVREWVSISEAGRNGFSAGCVCMCCQGKNENHNGFIWKYSEE